MSRSPKLIKKKIGLFPEDWDIIRMIDIISYDQTGLDISKINQHAGKEGTLYLKMNNITLNGFLDFKNIVYVDLDNETIDKYKLKDDDLLFNIRNSLKLVGKSAVYNSEYSPVVFNNNIVRYRFNEKTNSKFINYYFHSKTGRAQIHTMKASITSVVAIYKKDIVKIKVALPPINEQNKICSILINIDKLIVKTQKIINILSILKKGLMQRLFMGGIGHTEFKETRLGKIPKTWDLSQIDKKCEKIYAGGTPLRKRKEYYENGAILWIKSGEMNNSQIFDTEEKINDLGLKNSSAKIFPSKTVLFALYGATAGRVAFIEKPMTSNQACLGLICKNDELYYLFLFYSFQYKYKSIISQRIGGAQPNLNAEQVKKLKIAIPPLSEQKEIVNILRTVDDRINNENNFNNLLKKNKKGLMQDLLTGKRRVKIN